MVNDPDARVSNIFFKDAFGAISGTVVDNNELEIGIALAQNAIDGVGECFSLVVNWKNDADQIMLA